MTPDQIVTAFCNAFTRGALDDALALVTTDCVYHNIPLEPVRGTQAMRETLEGFVKILGSIRLETLHQVANGNLVMNERVDYFTPPGGKKYGLPVMGVFEIRDGKIAAWRDYFDIRQFETGVGIKFT